jgi:capsular exopolysaccharide synthesis family protein
LGELEARLGERHPSLLNARAELSTLRTQIANEVNRIIASLANEVEVARSRLRPLEASLAETRMKLVTDEQALVRVRELDREAAASREVYESFLKRSQEISDQSRLSSTDAVVASQAVAPTKRASPKLLLSLLMAVAAAALAGIAAALAVDHFRDSVTDARLTARRVGVPVIAQIPLLTRKALLQLPAELRTPGAFLIEKPLTAFAEAFRTLQSSFWFSGLSSNVRCVAVTSPLAGEGKSTVALCLARAAAQAGRRTLLVDCDLRRPSISEYFEIDPTAGVNEVLGGSVPWRDVVGMDDRSSLHILPAVAATPVHDVFAGSAIRSLLDDLRTEYDLIVLNGPPVLLVSEALSLAAAADAVAVIARWGETSHEALANALEQLASVGAPVHGLVVNAVDAATPFSGVYRDRRYYPQERV